MAEQAWVSVCGAHPHKKSVDTCAECRRPVCVDCMQVFNYRTVCTECAHALGHMGEPSALAKAALICGVIPLVTCIPLPLGIASLIMGYMELDAIEAGRSPARGRGLAKGGIILGWVQIALFAIGAAVAIMWAIATIS